MNRKYIESFLGKEVKIKLFDGDIIIGELHKTREQKFKNQPNLYIPKNYYFCIYSSINTLVKTSHVANSYLFRSSYIRKIEELTNKENTNE